MIRRATATRYDRVADSGRNKPLRIGVEMPNGDEVDVILKPSGRPEVGVEGMANEALAAMLGGDVGLPISEPLLVDLPADWIASIPDVEVRRVLLNSVPIGFGSTVVGSQWKLWSASDRLSPSMVPSALTIFAFDAFVANDDRRVGNANLLFNGRELRAIDHESAFKIRLKLFPRPEPWAQGNLGNLVAADGHVLGRELKGRRDLNMAPIRAAWAALTDLRIQQYEAAIPPEWHVALPYIQHGLAHIRAVRTRIDDCIVELQRVLA